MRTLPRAKVSTDYNDIAPRLGMAYDIFGNGKTAIKVNLSKYWQYAANDGVYIGTNPASTFAQTANRAWTNANRNFNPDCDPPESARPGQPRNRRRPVRRPGQSELFQVQAGRVW